jgi:hypothetical protein
MAEYGEHMGIQFEALEDLDTHLYHAVSLDDGKVANDGAEASGIILNKPKSGEAVNCGTVGDLPFQAGGAITKGNKLTVATSGYFTSAGSGDHLVGKAITTCVSGSVGRGQFNFNNPIYAFSSSFVA